MDDTFRCRIVTWDEIATWAFGLGAKIRESDFDPDVIVGLTRGGWLPARLLCDLLAIKRLYAVKVEHWGVTAQPDGKARLVQGLTVDISENRVLLVDDITDTGESLALAMQHVAEASPSQLRSATVLHITHSKFTPDFYEVEVPKEEWAWFIFPWNLHEDLRTIVPKALDGTARPVAEIKDALQSGFQLDLAPDLIEDTLKELAQAGTAGRKGDGYLLAPGTEGGSGP
ncbi:MAG: phosphoribosyltransferase [Thermoplasmata archaeon]